MPQPLRRTNAPINWSITAVSNHPVLTSGVGACITVFAATEASMGSFLAMVRWEDAPGAVEAWAGKRTIRDKLALVNAEAALTGPGHLKTAVRVLDAFTSLSKRRSRLAHGVFGIVTDRENQFAWREGAAPATRMAAALSSPGFDPGPQPRTWLYTPKDFADFVQDCADTFHLIADAMVVLPIVMGSDDPLPDVEKGS